MTVCKLLILDRNTWYHMTVCKLSILDGNTWYHMTVCKLLILDRNTWYHITVCKKQKTLKKRLHKNINVRCMWFSNL